jgi:DNA-binding transcriptional regulator YiaG
MSVCKTCQKPYEEWTSSIELPYHYAESGLHWVWLAGVSVHSCPGCEVAAADIPDLDGLHDLIARDILLTPLPMMGSELRFLRKETRLKPKEFADRLGVDPKTVANWEGSEKLNRQTDLTVRLFVATELWEGEALISVLTPLAEIAKYGWEGDIDDIDQDIAELAEMNTVLGINEQQRWAIA